MLFHQQVPDPVRNHEDLPDDQESLHKPELLLRHLHRHLPGQKIPVAVTCDFFRFRCLRPEYG